jgi:hypothetical protein
MTGLFRAYVRHCCTNFPVQDLCELFETRATQLQWQPCVQPHTANASELRSTSVDSRRTGANLTYFLHFRSNFPDLGGFKARARFLRCTAEFAFDARRNRKVQP